MTGIIPLEEVADIVSGFGFPEKLQGRTDGELPFFKVGDISAVWKTGARHLTKANHYLTAKEAEQIRAKAYPKGTIVFAKIGEALKLNRRAILNQPSLIDNNVMGLIPKENVVDALYLFYFMLTVKLGDMSQATTVPSVRKSDVKSIEVPIVPIKEQRLIVAEIEKQFSRLDEAVANLKRVKANLKRYKATVLKAAVEGKLTEEWRKAYTNVESASELLKRILVERRKKWEDAEMTKLKAKGKKPKDDKWKAKYVEAQPPKTEDTYELPNTWAWTNLGQLSWSVKDGPHFSPKYAESGVPFISGGNIRPEGIDLSTAKYITRELHAEFTERCKPEFGDLLYTKGGTTGIARINTEKREFSVWVHVAVLKLVDSIERFYLQHSLNSLHCYRQSQRYTHGVGNQDLGLTRMIWITVPLPPLEEQDEIVRLIDERMSIISDVENEVDINLQRAERMKQAILSKAFSGALLQAAATTFTEARHVRCNS